MGGNWGRFLRLTIFGESHGAAIGMVVDGLPPGVVINEDEIALDMARRAPGNDPTATRRKEPDVVRLISGVWQGRSTGAPICGVIENQNNRSGDYEQMRRLARPGHADYSGFVRYGGFNDVRGGGHFSGRLTAPMVFAGALAKQFLREKGITMGAHIASIASVCDDRFDAVNLTEDQLIALRKSAFPLIRQEREALMRQEVESARQSLDSVGGTIECAAIGVPAGWGSPFFDSVESLTSHLLFSIPAVKGVEFGDGFALSHMRGSQANDAFMMKEGSVVTSSNHNGGLNGGITNGMPIVFRVAIKPTPSIAKEQKTVDFVKKEDATIAVHGRHDPCIVLRAVPVMEAALAIALCETALEWEAWQ